MKKILLSVLFLLAPVGEAKTDSLEDTVKQGCKNSILFTDRLLETGTAILIVDTVLIKEASWKVLSKRQKELVASAFQSRNMCVSGELANFPDPLFFYSAEAVSLGKEKLLGTYSNAVLTLFD